MGGRNFPSRGLGCPGPAGRPFLFTERKGKWKRRGGRWRRLRRPGASSDAESPGLQRTAPPAADRPAFGRPPVVRTPVRLAPAGKPPAAHQARAPGGHTEHSGNRAWGTLSVFRGRSTWMPGGSHSETERASHQGTLGWPAARRYSWKAPCSGPREVWTRGSSPFLLLPGFRVTSQCRSGLRWWTGAHALTASPAGDAAWTAAFWLLSLGECNLEAEGSHYGCSSLGFFYHKQNLLI